jgi:hypothetical protein
MAAADLMTWPSAAAIFRRQEIAARSRRACSGGDDVSLAVRLLSGICRFFRRLVTFDVGAGHPSVVDIAGLCLMHQPQHMLT